jgi:hypothetical protein
VSVDHVVSHVSTGWARPAHAPVLVGAWAVPSSPGSTTRQCCHSRQSPDEYRRAGESVGRKAINRRAFSPAPHLHLVLLFALRHTDLRVRSGRRRSE